MAEVMTHPSIMQNSIPPRPRRVMLEVYILNRNRTGAVLLIRKRMTVAEAVRAARDRHAPGYLFIQSANIGERAWWEKR